MRDRRWALLVSLAACGVNPAFNADEAGTAASSTAPPASTGDDPPAPTASGSSGAPPASTGADDPTTTSAVASTTSLDPSTTSAAATTDDASTDTKDEEGLPCPEDDALVACYRFPAGEYATLVDDGPNGLDGKMEHTNLVSSIDGHGSAAEFLDQSRATVEFAEALNFAAYTLSAFVWVKSENRALIDKDGQYALFVDTNQATCILRSPDMGYTTVQAPIVKEEWLHLACTYDGATLKIYVQRKGFPPVINPTAWAKGVDETPSFLAIGRDAPEDSAVYVGLLDHVLLFSRALAPQELCVLAGPLCG